MRKKLSWPHSIESSLVYTRTYGVGSSGIADNSWGSTSAVMAPRRLEPGPAESWPTFQRNSTSSPSGKIP